MQSLAISGDRSAHQRAVAQMSLSIGKTHEETPMLTRRRLLQTGAAAGVAVTFPWSIRRAYPQTATPIDGSQLTKYVDALPIPSVLSPTSPGGSHYRVEMSEFSQQLHRNLPNPTTVWGYNGSYPGPTFETRKNKPITVEWVNDLPSTHLFTLDTTIEDSPADLPAVRVSPHLHGGHILSAFDGQPLGWFTSGSPPMLTGPAFAGTNFEYRNDQRAATLWYHDHAVGVTRLNVYAGLAGFYLIRDAVEESLNLPSGLYEIPLVIQDRMFDASGQLFYPSMGNAMSDHPVWVTEFFGNIALVNGKVWPFLEVEARKYRFRILNGSNTRFLSLHLFLQQSSTEITFTQIGSEGGLLPEPVLIPDQQDLTLAPAERADVIVDFAPYAGQSIVMKNDATNGATLLPEIMQFRVTLPLSGRDTSSLPKKLPAFRRLNPNSAVNTRSLNLNHMLDPTNGKLEILLMGPNFAGLPFLDPTVTEMPRDHSTEIWSFLNLTPSAHPIHLHLVQFQVLDRQNFNLPLYVATQGSQLQLMGDPMPPDPNEMGWKDTVRANTGQLTRIIARFDALPDDRIRKFMWHCHILEHEDNSMMRPYVLV
jgi:spore coat protein A